MNIKFGNIEIDLPNESARYFSIFTDLTGLFDVKYQSEAVAILKQKLKYLETKPVQTLIMKQTAHKLTAGAQIQYLEWQQ